MTHTHLEAGTRRLARPSGLLGRLVAGLRPSHRGQELCHAALEALAVRTGDHVLEIGFGDGAVLAPLLRAAGKGGVVGLETSALRVTRARRRFRRELLSRWLELRVGHVERMLFGNESFDRILSVESVHVWPDLAAALREIERVLRPGGRLVLAFRSPGRRAHGSRLGFTLRAEREVVEALRDAHLRVAAVDHRDDHGSGSVVVVAEKAARAG